MILNAHSYYSLRFGVVSIEDLVQQAVDFKYEAIALTDINNSSGVLEFVKVCIEKGVKPIVGMEFRNANELLFVAIAMNNEGFRELNELMTKHNFSKEPLPIQPSFNNCFVIYPYPKPKTIILREYEYIGVSPNQLNKIALENPKIQNKYIILQSYTYKDYQGYETHKKLRAIHNNILLSQLQIAQIAKTDEAIVPLKKLLNQFEDYPHLIENTKFIINNCEFNFDFKVIKNKQIFTTSPHNDKILLQKLAYDGLVHRYGKKNKIALERVNKELEIIDTLGFSSYFLITNDIVRYSRDRGFYHVGRGSGANSVVAYCLRITDVCPIELDLYFERFLNPKRKSPPDFDIDYSWKERDEVLEYIFKRYGKEHTALLGAMSTFKDRSIIREMGKVYGLPKEDIDRLIKYPTSPINENEICKGILQHYSAIEDYPNLRTMHAGGVVISELPLSYYTALDMPPKGFPTTQFDMYTAEDIGFEKLDILSQRGIGHIKDASEIVFKNRGIKVDVHDIRKFKTDEKVKQQIKSGDTIGCFYIESPAMRGLLKKLHCDTYLTLVAASSIIRPGVAQSGMMKAYIERFHHPEKILYLHPIMEQQLKETYGVMVYQEDVLKVGHHFGGLDLADADVLRRMMSGKSRNKKHLLEIEEKYFNHCNKMGYPENISREVWRQIESFAGYSFSKAHSASYAVESYQSLYLKTYYPLEFMVAVINNFGGFYSTRVYINEARKGGGIIHVPCINKSTYLTTIYDKDIYLGFIHIKSLDSNIAQLIETDRDKNGLYLGLVNFIERTKIGIESLQLLIRLNCFRFTGKNKKELLWEAHLLFQSAKKPVLSEVLFKVATSEWEFPQLTENKINDVYDEMELLEYPVTLSEFDLLKTKQRSKINTKNLLNFLGQKIKIMGNYVTYKPVRTKTGNLMAFGTFLDSEGNFFDTTHFSFSLKTYPFNGNGIYYILGKVVEDFGFPSIEVEKMVKLEVLKKT